MPGRRWHRCSRYLCRCSATASRSRPFTHSSSSKVFSYFLHRVAKLALAPAFKLTQNAFRQLQPETGGMFGLWHGGSVVRLRGARDTFVATDKMQSVGIIVVIIAGRIDDLRGSGDVQLVCLERDTQVAQVVLHVR